MNNINTHNYSEESNKSSRWNKLPYTLLLISLLSLNNPTEAKAVNTYNFNQQGVEVLADSGIVSNIERRTWIALPTIYADKIKNFVSNNELMKRHSAAEFTENFIVNQMKFDWWISKQNQLLFIWDAVHEQITKKNFYDWEDWNNNRLSEFENSMDSIENCWKKYKKEFIVYMEWRSAEADRRSAEARQQSAEARQQSAEARQQTAEARQQSAEARQQSAEARQQSAEATYSWLNDLIRFYNFYKENPNIVKAGDIKEFKEHSKRIIQNCKKYNIDYKAKLSPEILKFYGIE